MATRNRSAAVDEAAETETGQEPEPTAAATLLEAPQDTAPAAEQPAEKRVFDERNLVYVYDKATGEKLTNPVPETWLDGRFPNLSETPLSKAGK